MIGDILEQNASIQSSLSQDGEDSEAFDWEMPNLKDLSPIDLCTRLPFSVSPWLSSQHTNADHRLTPQDTNHKIGSKFAGLLLETGFIHFAIDSLTFALELHSKTMLSLLVVTFPSFVHSSLY